MITDSLKRAPRWAWFTVAGISAGAIGIKIWKDRDAEPSEKSTGTEVGSSTYGSVGTSGSPTPVITPPVIIGGTGGDDGGLAQFVSVIGGNFDTLVSGITQLAQGDQALAGQGMSGITEIATSIIAGAGSAPAPIAQAPTPVIVNVTPPQAPSVSLPAQSCAQKYPSYPKHNGANGAPSPRSCYQEDNWCQDKRKRQGHKYKDGHRVVMSTGGKC